jgi:hypothetical protein
MESKLKKYLSDKLNVSLSLPFSGFRSKGIDVHLPIALPEHMTFSQFTNILPLLNSVKLLSKLVELHYL